jgi:hypothetical protein
LLDIRGINLGSLDASASKDDSRNLLNYISDEEDNGPSRLLARSELNRLLTEAIEKLPCTERIVISLYYLIHGRIAQVWGTVDPEHRLLGHSAEVAGCCGRDDHYWSPPAQNRTGAFTHPAPALDEWR